jgi:hypothetical protein
VIQGLAPPAPVSPIIDSSPVISNESEETSLLDSSAVFPNGSINHSSNEGEKPPPPPPPPVAQASSVSPKEPLYGLAFCDQEAPPTPPAPHTFTVIELTQLGTVNV